VIAIVIARPTEETVLTVAAVAVGDYNRSPFDVIVGNGPTNERRSIDEGGRIPHVNVGCGR
jgi:hypothetical protein